MTTTRLPETPDPGAVTVVGLGPMGRALAGALLRAGHDVTVWNRTLGKAAELVTAGARLADSPAAALTAAPTTIACLVDDDAVTAVVHQAAQQADLRGRTLVNLTADSPARTRVLARDLATLGVDLVDGAIMTPAAAIGTDATRILYAGPRPAYEARRDLLAAFGGEAFHVGEDVAAAASHDVALLTLFWSAIAGLAQALALTRAEGLDVTALTPHAVAMSRLVTDLLPGLVADVAAGRWSGAESASLDSLAASLDHLRTAHAGAGVSTELLDALAAAVGRAIAAGHGGDAPIRLVETLADGAHRR